MNTRTIEIELLGEEYEAEVAYWLEDDAPTLCSVSLLKQTCPKDGVWYDREGNPHWGENWLKVDITDLLSADQIKTLAEEILEEVTKEAAETMAEEAMGRYLRYRSTGYFRRFEPAAFSGALA